MLSIKLLKQMFPSFVLTILLSITYLPAYYNLCMLQNHMNSRVSFKLLNQKDGVGTTIDYLNTDVASNLLRKLVLLNEKISDESSKYNFWTGGNFLIKGARCEGIEEKGLQLRAECEVKGKIQYRDLLVPFSVPVTNEVSLKYALIKMAQDAGCLSDTGFILSLPFGQDLMLPANLRFNDVPHAAWLRSYIYDTAAKAVGIALQSPPTLVPNKSRMQLKVNVPEMNPAFDTYRIGTVLEMVRGIVLPLVREGKKVRICVQQSLGEGVFAGMPLALSSMRPVLERMDWCGFNKPGLDGRADKALVTFGTVGREQIEGNDFIIVICPQNVLGGSLMESLEEMVTAAGDANVPLLLINPLLQDRPSGNNIMQVRGRAERRQFADSFQEIHCLRLLYPSSGGYMFPIRGVLFKAAVGCPYVAYRQEKGVNAQETYMPIAAFPDTFGPPDSSMVSSLLC